MNYYKFIDQLWAKQCIEKTEIVDLVQERLAAKRPERCSKKLPVKVCNILTNKYCDSGKERNIIFDDERLIINP
jgi:hypothetical protein